MSLRRKRRSRLLITVLTVAVTILFSYIALRGIDFKTAWHGLRTSDYFWLLPALLALGLAMICRALRWRSLFAAERRPPLGTVSNAMTIGYFYNSILPARAGEAARILVLNQRSSSPPVEITATVVLERLYDVVAILVIFFVSEPWLPSVSWLGTAATVAVVLAVMITAATLILAFYGDRPLRVLLRPVKRVPLFSDERLERTVHELAHGLSGLRHHGIALVAFIWTILAWLFSALCAYLVSLAFNMHLPFAGGVLVTVAVGLSMILPSPPAAIGVFEGATLIALKAYAVPHSIGLPYAIVLHLVNFVPLVIVGALLLQYNTRHPRRAQAGAELEQRPPAQAAKQLEPPVPQAR